MTGGDVKADAMPSQPPRDGDIERVFDVPQMAQALADRIDQRIAEQALERFAQMGE